MELKAKDVSLWGKIAGCAILTAGSVLKWLGVFGNCDVRELCIVSYGVAGLFGTVDINLMLEKICGRGNAE